MNDEFLAIVGYDVNDDLFATLKVRGVSGPIEMLYWEYGSPIQTWTKNVIDFFKKEYGLIELPGSVSDIRSDYAFVPLYRE